MLIDYYQILGTTPDASLEVIKAAYRKKAFECHPDVGGTHEAMVRVNEAWQVLSNPALRAEYDKLRQQHNDRSAIVKWERKSENARERAKEYPKSWRAFQNWLDALSKDVTDAKYGEENVLWMTTQTVSNSYTGALFMLIGTLLFGAISIMFNPFQLSDFKNNGSSKKSDLSLFARDKPTTTSTREASWESLKKDPRIILTFVIGPWVLGCSAGAVAHRYLSSYLKTSQPTDSASSQSNPDDVRSYTVITCPKCSTHLRVPLMKSVLTITCTRCRHKFDHA